MTREDLVLSSMGSVGMKNFQPVQIQKLIFLFQEKAPDKIEKFFSFEPYDYGPFDPSVYDTLEILSIKGLVEIVGQPFTRYRQYRLTEKGLAKSKEKLKEFTPNNKKYLKTLSDWVLSISFPQLVSAVYKEFPKMKVNSIFENYQ